MGVGSDIGTGTAIPKLNEDNQLIGYWSAESFAMQPGIAQISEANIGVRDDNVAPSANDRYLSKLDEKYLQSIAELINGKYVNGDSLQNILAAMKNQAPARRDKAAFELKWIFAGLSGLSFLAAYMPKHPIKEIKTTFNQFLARRKRQASTSGTKPAAPV